MSAIGAKTGSRIWLRSHDLGRGHTLVSPEIDRLSRHQGFAHSEERTVQGTGCGTEARSTYRRYLRHKPFYAIYDVGDYTFSPYKVVWMEQQNPREFRACVISDLSRVQSRHRQLLPDHKLYMLSLDDKTEAHYVCGVLNSRHLRRILGGFLVGKQIGTTVFRYVGIPIYDHANPRHREIADRKSVV